ncbi:MAG: hypothetical protein SGJ21_00030 [Alphaproteobacteria bacterium]|nr:hypothetical protein [Alphaproteobacteria bacterium]
MDISIAAQNLAGFQQRIDKRLSDARFDRGLAADYTACKVATMSTSR